MFVLDTNVLSAMMGGALAPEVAAWVAAQPEEELFTASVPPKARPHPSRGQAWAAFRV